MRSWQCIGESTAIRTPAALGRNAGGRGADGRSVIRWLDEKLRSGQREEILELFEELPDPFDLPLNSYSTSSKPAIGGALRAGLKLAEAWMRREPESPRPSTKPPPSLPGRPLRAGPRAASPGLGAGERAGRELLPAWLHAAAGKAPGGSRTGFSAKPCPCRRAWARRTRISVSSLISRGDGKAIQQFRRAIQLDPHNAMGHMNLGALYGEQGEYELAITLSRRPWNSARAALKPAWLGWLSTTAGATWRRCKSSSKSCPAAPARRGALLRGRVPRPLGGPSQALAAFRRAERIYPRSAHPLQLGLCHVNMNDHEEALAYFLRVAS